MKTKHILTALALPVMFAACTADDIVSVNNGLQQAERAKLSKDFVLNVSNGVESRYVVESDGAGLKFNFEEGDLIGANLIDVYDPSNYRGEWDAEDPKTWGLIESINPAQPFKNVGGDAWKSDNELGIGNYLFNYPFNKADNGRAAAKFELPVVQQYDSKNPNAFIEDYNKAVGTVVLYEGQTSADVALKNLYTYPQFVINFDNGVDVNKVTKVVLKSSTAKFHVKGGINNAAVVANFEGAEALEKDFEGTKDELKEALKEYWAELQTADFVRAHNENDKYATSELSEYIIVEMDEAVKADNNNNKNVSVRVMMPSVESFRASDIVMYVVTDNGTYSVGLNAYSSKLDLKDPTSDATDKALWRSKANTLKTVNLTVTDKSTAMGNIVTTAADWNKLVAAYGNDSKPVEVAILSEKFALTSALNMPKKATFKINTDVAVEGNVALSNLEVKNTAGDATVIVKEGATLTTSQTFAANNIEVEEGANLVFAAAYDTDEELVAYNAVSTVDNHGTVTVPAGVIAQFELTNAKDAVVNVGAASRAAEVAVAYLNGSNDGEINNYGEIRIAANKTFTNNDPSTDAGYEVDKKTQEFTEFPTVNNEGEFLVEGTSASAKGTFANDGLFVNNGTLAGATKFGQITNAGTIESKLNAITYVKSSTGKVVVYEAAPADFDVEGGEIEFTPATSPVDLKASPVTHLIVEKTMVISSTYLNNNGTKDDATDDYLEALPKMTVINDATISFTKDNKDADNNDLAEVTELIVKEGVKATLGGNITVGTLNIEETAKVSIPAEKKLSVLESYTNEGTIYVNGVLSCALISYNDGDFGTLVEAEGSDIYSKEDKDAADNTQNQQTAAALATAQKNALRTLVDAYLMYSDDLTANTTWSQVTVNQIKVTNWDGADNYWGVTVVADFVSTWDAITNLPAADKIGNLSGDALEAKIEGLFDKYSALIYTAKNGNTAASGALVDAQAASLSGIKAAISKALEGNAWVGENVFVKSLQNQKESAIKSAEGVVMYDAFKTAFEGLTYAKMGNTAWMTIKDIKAAVDNTETTPNEAYPNNIYSYIPEYSYVETYQGAAVYSAVELWISLSQEYAGELKNGAYDFDPAKVVAANMVKFFNEANMAKQTNGKFATDKLFKNATSTITDSYIETVSEWSYNNGQIAKLANEFAEEYGINTNITPAK